MMSQLILWRTRSARVAWLSSMLVLLLQRTPVLRVLASMEFTVGVRLGEMLRALVPVALAAGAVDTLTGATTLVTNPVSPASGQVGTSFTMVFAYTGGSATPDSYAIFGIMPPGLSVPNATGAAGNLTLNRTNGSIQGTPTTAGSFTIEIEAFDGQNRAAGEHGSSGRIPVTINIQAVETAPSFTLQPVSSTVAFGANATFTVTVAGTPTPTVQWRKGGSPISGATSTTLTLNNVVLGDAGSFDCVATNSVNSATSTAATLTVTPPAAPAITTQPVALTSRTGSGAYFAVRATGLSLAYQWKKNSSPISGATASSFYLPTVVSGDTGNYSVDVTNPGGAATSASVALTVSSTGSARLANLSARAQVGAGDGNLIPGFVITGGGSKSLLIRGIGPTLGSFGVTGVLADPLITVSANGIVQGSNDDWGQAPDPAALEAARVQAGAFPLVVGSKDASLLATIPANGSGNTAATSGVGGATGVALVELYDLDAASSPARMINISARAQVGVGNDLLVPGFVIEGDVGLTLLIRGVGPTLGGFGVGGVLADPVMTLIRSLPANQSEIVTSNDNWEQNPDPALIVSTTSTVGGFGLAAGGADSALLVTLKPGAYTVQIAGKNSTTGVALVELYVVGP